MRLLLHLLTLCLVAIAPALRAQTISYPTTARVDHVDDYQGTPVADPYRWLEQDTAAAVARWVTAQNTVTFAHFAQVPFRSEVKTRLETLYNYPKLSAPWQEGPYFLFFKNAGLQNQSVLYIQRGLDGAPSVLIDPNVMSADGTTRLGPISLSRDSRYTAYGLSRSGSDWLEIEVMETATRKMLPDRVQWVKVSGISWKGNGFYYSRYPAPADTGIANSSRNENHMVYYHRLGTPQEADEVIFADSAHPQRFHFARTTEDERFLILSVSDRGTGKDGNALYLRDLAKGDTAFRPIVQTFDDDFNVIDNVADKLLVMTNKDAPNWRVVLIDPANPAEAKWREILPSQPEVLQDATTAGGRLFATYLKDVSHRVHVYDLWGKFEREIRLPGLGTVGGFGGERGSRVVFYSFSSFTTPPTIYGYDVKAGRSPLHRRTEVKFDPDAYEAKQMFYPSKDGTRIPIFLVARKGVRLDGQNPTLLYGYGGFNANLLPSFDPLLVAFLEQGGVYAQANLRGGGEYGERWHQAGMKENKQNVFDDFIAAAEWLIANRYTSAERLAVQGRSNGGLLVGAVVNQRPELFKVALPAVGVMDMLRFHKFTIGWNWIADYGTSDDPEGFRYLYAYSPLHNLRPANYPATLVTTADHDDRVVPAHSFKYIAMLQNMQRGFNPVLIRIETRSGHGSSSTSKRIEETADVYSFMMYHLGMQPRYPPDRAATP